MREVRVRFAPSPTGALHIGGVRTALYNYLFARGRGGKFILRIEDTDSARFVAGAEEYIVESLKWCGIEVDEGVGVGGPHAPYRQSERAEIYLKYAEQLVVDGWAYYAFDTAAALDEIRRQTEEAGGVFAYNYSVRESLDTSLHMAVNGDPLQIDRQIQDRIAAGEQYVIRFKMPVDQVIEMHDLVRGDVRVNSSTLDDKVLYKSHDGLPTYHLANIVDDYLMDISHVIRGEEWLPSLPLHVMLYRAFGWTDRMPEFAHLPLLLKPTGAGKLSKRDGDKLGFPVFPLRWVSPTDIGDTARGYREDGYFPDALVNFLALLGWNPGGEREIFSMEELSHLFSIEKVGKSGSRFDYEKAKWFNAQYLRMRSDAELAVLFMPILTQQGVTSDVSGMSSAISASSAEFVRKVERVCSLIKERATFVSEFWELGSFYFVKPEVYDAKVVDKFWKGDNPSHLLKIGSILSEAKVFSAPELEAAVKAWIEEAGLPMGQIMNTLRLVVVGRSAGASIFDIIEIIGQQETLDRIQRARQVLGA